MILFTVGYCYLPAAPSDAPETAQTPDITASGDEQRPSIQIIETFSEPETPDVSVLGSESEETEEAKEEPLTDQQLEGWWFIGTKASCL